MSLSTLTTTSRPISHSYIVVMLDYGHAREAIVDPEVTRREVVSRIADGNYPREQILFVQYVNGVSVEDITADVMGEAMDREAA